MSESHYDEVLATKVARAELMKRVLIVVTAVMVTVLLISQAVLISQIRATQQTGSPVLKAILGQQDDIKVAAKAATSTNEQILDCLDPGGKCFEESQRRSADVLAQVQLIIVLAAACAADVTGDQSVEQRQDSITACIAKRLAEPAPS